jgi:hypothetical protein
MDEIVSQHALTPLCFACMTARRSTVPHRSVCLFGFCCLLLWLLRSLSDAVICAQYALQAALAKAQLADTHHRISERNAVEIVLKLLELKKVQVRQRTRETAR